MPNGIAITTGDTPIQTAPDYKMSIDSRWKFLEVAQEGTLLFNIPYIAPSGGGLDSGTLTFTISQSILNHGLNFFPLYDMNATVVSGTLTTTGASNATTYDVRMDDNDMFVILQYYPGNGTPAATLQIKYIIYNLDITQTYVAGEATYFGKNSGAVVDYGAQFLDSSGTSALGMNTPVGFSLDSTKKTVSIHQIGTYGTDSSTALPTINHTVGYPPTYIITHTPYTPYSGYYSGFAISFRNKVFCDPITIPVARITATNYDLTIHGIQSVFAGVWCVIILKDPVGEI